MSAKPNIALLHPYHWEEVRRGTERLVSELSVGLLGDGFRVVLITTHRGDPTSTVEAGMPIIRNRRPALRLPGAFSRHQLTHVPFTYASLRRGSFDLAHAFHPADALAAVGWARRAKRPAVFTVPAFPPRHGSRARLGTLRRVFTGSDTIVAPTRAVSEEITELFPGTRVRLIPPGVDLDRFTPGDGRSPQPTIFCAAAIEEPRKRVKLVVEAFSVLRRERPDARLILANPYPHQTEFPHWASGPGLDIRGIRDDSDLVSAYREAWVSVLAALDEPFGLVLVESLACGRPVVGARAGGIPEIIDRDGIGGLFDGEDPETLAEVLSSALDLAADGAVPERCRARAAEFQLDRCVGAYEDLYTELLDGL